MPQISLYNTLSRRKELFKPLNAKKVTLYTCGPTVYESPSIGNWRTYVFEDVLKRTLEYAGFRIKHVMNITDVGHLTSDADSGQDKLQQTANRDRVSAWQIAKRYENEFYASFKKLNIYRPTKFTRATDYIQEQINLIKRLEKKNFTYQTTDGVYFDTAKIKNYGHLAKLNIQGLKEGYRVKKNSEKKNMTDFALWKFSPKDERRDMEWPSPWGVGFPGWHIECSAMIFKELGEQIDIHGGGVDLIPTHHTNEIAQSEAISGKSPFVRYWLHGEFLLIDGGRMGKSLGNAYTLDDIEARGFDPLDLKFFFYSAHYRQKLNFTWQALSGSRQALNRIRLDVKWLMDRKQSNLPDKQNIGGRAYEVLLDFEKSIFNDLNVPRGLVALNTIVDSNDLQTNKKVVRIGERLAGDQGRVVDIEQRLAVIGKMDKILGLDLLSIKRAKSITDPKLKIPEEIQTFLKERNLARQEQNWIKADEMRKTIEKLGYKVIDSEDGTKLTIK